MEGVWRGCKVQEKKGVCEGVGRKRAKEKGEGKARRVFERNAPHMRRRVGYEKKVRGRESKAEER